MKVLSLSHEFNTKNLVKGETQIKLRFVSPNNPDNGLQEIGPYTFNGFGVSKIKGSDPRKTIKLSYVVYGIPHTTFMEIDRIHDITIID